MRANFFPQGPKNFWNWNEPWLKITFNFWRLQGWKIPGKFPGRADFSGKFPVSWEAQNAGKLETLNLSLQLKN